MRARSHLLDDETGCERTEARAILKGTLLGITVKETGGIKIARASRIHERVDLDRRDRQGLVGRDDDSAFSERVTMERAQSMRMEAIAVSSDLVL